MTVHFVVIYIYPKRTSSFDSLNCPVFAELENTTKDRPLLFETPSSFNRPSAFIFHRPSTLNIPGPEIPVAQCKLHCVTKVISGHYFPQFCSGPCNGLSRESAQKIFETAKQTETNGFRLEDVLFLGIIREKAKMEIPHFEKVKTRLSLAGTV